MGVRFEKNRRLQREKQGIKKNKKIVKIFTVFQTINNTFLSFITKL